MARFLVTGANRGIGLEFVTQLSSRGDEVVALCRKASKELKDLKNIKIVENVELRKLDSLTGVADKIDGQFDAIINNAGVLFNEDLEALDFASIAIQMEINAFAPLALVNAFKSKLNQGSKVAMITSRMGSIEDNSSGGYYGYRMSKAALNAASKSLSIDLASKGVSIGIYHPGFVRTEMTGFQGTINPDQSVNKLLRMIDKLGPEDTGKFYHVGGTDLPW
jgi:NAD(P)-dependent dehydrogenase (short-subunit alcohol dehydrogenase family)